MKKRTNIVIGGLLGVLFILSGAAHAELIAFQTGVDSGTYNYGGDDYTHSASNASDWAYQDGYGEAAGVKSGAIFVSGTAGNNDKQKGWFGFTDMFGSADGQIPIGSTINSATLKVRVYNASAADVNIQFNRVVNDANSWFGGDASWVNLSHGGSTSWVNLSDVAVANMGEASSATTESVLLDANADTSTWLDVNVSGSVSAWVASASGNDQNMGWSISLDSDTAPQLNINSPTFASIFGPALLVDYTPIPEPATLGLFGLTALVALLIRRMRR